MSDRHPLVEQVLAGDNPSLSILAAQGLLPLGPDELIPLQIELTAASDEQVAVTARESLGSLDSKVLLPFLEEEAGPDVLGWFAANVARSDVLTRIIRHRAVPPQVLVDIAPALDESLQEALLLRQDKIVDHPEILDALEKNSRLSRFSRRRIDEYRTHLVTGFAEEPEVTDFPEEEGPVWVVDEEVRAAFEEVAEVPPEGEVDLESGLSEGQIRLLPIPVRLKLAQGASKAMRSVLIRDNNPRVAVACVKGSPLGDSEVEHICRNRSIVEEVLEEIARERRYIQKYPIAHALVCNPRTPLTISMKLVPRLSVRDLRNLKRDRNIPDAVRKTADRLYKLKLG